MDLKVAVTLWSVVMTAADRVYHIIKQRILNGGYTAGSYVREAAIGEELDYSRTPIREALRRRVF